MFTLGSRLSFNEIKLYRECTLCTYLQHGIFEKFTQEGGGQIHAEIFVGSLGMLSNFQHCVRTHCQEETSWIENLGRFNQSPIFGNVQVSCRKMISGIKLGHQGPVLSGDQDSALSCGVFSWLLVLDKNASFVGNFLKGLTRLVSAYQKWKSSTVELWRLKVLKLTNTTKIGHRLRFFKEPLGNSDGILSGSTGNVVNFVVG